MSKTPLGPKTAGWIAKTKALKSKKPFGGKWQRTPRKVDSALPRILTDALKEQWGSTALYRDHVNSMGKLRENADMRGDDLVAQFQHLPPTLGAVALTCCLYDKPDEVSFLFGKAIKKGGQYISTTHVVCVVPGKISLYCIVEGTTAWFVEHNSYVGLLRKSLNFSATSARIVMNDQHRLQNLQWVQTIQIPQPV